MRFFFLIFLWLNSLIAAVAIVKGLSIGPTIFVVSENRGWGIHSGDFLALIPLALGVVGTRIILKKPVKTLEIPLILRMN